MKRILDSMSALLNKIAPWTHSTVAGRRLTVANLAAQCLIVVTGGAVRLTGSGLGCSSWPVCEPGAFTPEFHAETSYHAYIEFGNRTLTGVLLVIAILMTVTVWRTKASLTRHSLYVIGGILFQAILGGITVIVHLHPMVVAVHLLVSLWLVWVSTTLALHYRGAQSTATRPFVSNLQRASLPLLIIVVMLGTLVTGSGPHSGDAERAQRLAADPELLARVHAAAVWLYGLFVLTLAWLLRRSTEGEGGDSLATASQVLLGITIAQGGLGYLQYFTGLPIVLVAGHLLGATLLVAAHAALWSLSARQAAAPVAS